jgi:hypothetical protein
MRKPKLCEHRPNQCVVYRDEYSGVLIAECHNCGKYRRLDRMGALWQFFVDKPEKVHSL